MDVQEVQEAEDAPAVDDPGSRSDFTIVGDGDEAVSPYPETIIRAADAEPLSSEEIVSATDWLLADDEDLAKERQPTIVKIDLGNGTKMAWHLRPLDPDEFKGCNTMAMGSRAAQEKALKRDGLSGLFDQRKYERLIVTLATVEPDLEAAAARKGVTAPDIVAHRFQYKPGWITELAGIVNEISGYDSNKIEVVESAVGNS